MWKNLDDPRGAAKSVIKTMATEERWNRNQNFINGLREKINKHPIKDNAARTALLNKQFSFENMKQIHLEYRHAIVQIFTDALTIAQFNTVQLEERGIVPPGGKLAPRFLITLNNLDEFGFRPGLDRLGYYKGNPEYAHYPLFEALLNGFKISAAERMNYKPSYLSRCVRQYLIDSFSKLENVVTLIAVGEVQVILFSNPLRVNSAAVGVDTSTGYYQVHGTEEHGAPDANDDDHEDDCWAVLALALDENDYGRIERLALGYLDIWDDFWNQQNGLLSGQ